MNLTVRVERHMRLLGNTLGLRSTKVFAIGFNKTGTSSLHALFESLARPSFHGVEWRDGDRPALMRRYDCFSDGIPRNFAQLDKDFPRARFILQVRELGPWLYSRLAHIEREQARGSYRTQTTWDKTADAVKGWITKRNEYHCAVLDHFAQRSSDLLVINFTRDPDSASRVAHFIGHSQQVARPERNCKPEKTPPAAHQELVAGCVASLGIELADLERDLLCPGLLEPGVRCRYPSDTRQLAERGSNGSHEGGK